MKMRFLKLFLFSAIAVLSAKAVYADACVVATEKSDYSKTNTLPYIIDYHENSHGKNISITYNRSTGGCFINNDYADKATADQYVAFQTAETEPADTSDIVRTIVLTSTLDFKPLDPMVVGNPSDAAINDPDTEATYDVESTKYIWEDGVIKDYGFIVIDGRQNFAKKSDGAVSTDNLPMKCHDGSSDVFLRNMIIITNGYSKTDLLADDTTATSCFKDGGNLHVCNGTYTEGSDPNTDSNWCNEDSTTGTFPGIEVRPGDIGSLFGCDEEDKITWYADNDADGFGDASDSKTMCPQFTPSGYVQDDTDCDDTNADINPDAEEICDDVDNNCDALIDDEELGEGVCTATESEICTDGIDNDGDTLVDCADEEDCSADTTCFSEPVTEVCDDSIDNDTDGYTDCDDDECDTAYACNGVGPEEECSDGIDNDEDTATDCDDDDCTSDAYCTPVTTETLCTDGLDDDGDTYVDCDDSDCVNDSACAVPATTETLCSDGLDDDGDGSIDCDDSDCVFATECVNASESDCTDGLDDDGDGLTDCDDDDCADVVVDDSGLTCAELDINAGEPADDMAGGGCGCNLTAQKAPVLQNLFLALLGLIPLMAAVVLRRRARKV